MATLLDVGLLGHFAPVFTFLLVYVLVFAFLSKTKLLGDNKGTYAIIALVLAALTLFFPPVVSLITIMAPWFIFLMITIFFILLVFMSFGIKAEAITEVITKDKLVMWVILGFGIAIFLFGLSQVFGDVLADGTGNSIEGEEGAADSTNFNSDVTKTIFHPKVAGVFFLLIIAALAIKLLSMTPPV